MSDSLLDLRKALETCELAYATFPLMYPFEPVIRELTFLIRKEMGLVSQDEMQAHRPVPIGWIAVRELDGYEDRALIQLLCKISCWYETQAR
jgi:hypothetical protein